MSDSTITNARRRGLVKELRDAADRGPDGDLYRLAAEEIEHWRGLECQAANHVEAVICLSSSRFTGEPPYVGWEGLGLALRQDYDELKLLQKRIARARAYIRVLRQDHSDRSTDELARHADAIQMFLEASGDELLRSVGVQGDTAGDYDRVANPDHSADKGAGGNA